MFETKALYQNDPKWKNVKLGHQNQETIGTWGCLPKYYPTVLKMVQDEQVAIEPFIETRPMSQIQQAFDDVHKGGLDKRIVLIPDF